MTSNTRRSAGMVGRTSRHCLFHCYSQAVFWSASVGSRSTRPRARSTGRGTVRASASRARGASRTGVRGARRPCRRSQRRGASSRAAPGVGPSGRSCRNSASSCWGGGRASASPRSARRGAIWTRGSGGGGGATTGSQGAGSGPGSGERAAWAGRWPGTRSRRPTARGVCVRAPRWRWRGRSAPSPREDCHACVRVDPPTASADPPET